jgi:signal transduction histidine kinase
LALRALTHLCVAGVSDSADEYWHLHQAEAAGQVRALEQALAEVNAIENARSVGWHQATHDLRGSITVVSAATHMLDDKNITEPERQQMTSLLGKGMSSLRDMLNNLTDLARLEAGHEQRTLAPLDAAVLLNAFCLTMRPLADSQGLYLRCEGPDSLPIEGDRAKVQRILQNLVLNALKHTEQGGVVVRWESRKESDADRWMVSVQDTGPGFDAATNIPIATQLRDATQEAHEVEDNATASGTSSNQDRPAVTLPSQSPRGSLQQQAGEGIGLSIVKGLCDLLDATLELETDTGQGSTFRVTFPCVYQNSPR